MKISRLKASIIQFIVIATLILVGCDWPFNTEVTDDNVFKISAYHNIKRVMPVDTLIISWDEITIDGTFDKYRIERRLITDTLWTQIADIYDPFKLSYVDTISDDDDLIYRVQIIAEEGFEIWETITVEIPNTDSIIVPTEFDTIFNAIKSPLADDGDIIFVEPGLYQENLTILGKDIVLKSTQGRTGTTIDGGVNNYTIAMGNSIIDGFTIVDGATRRTGGGVLINGDGIVKNCIITGNYAEGMGGGVYVNGNGSIYNTIINSNLSPTGSGVYIKDGHGELINNTIVNNDIFIDGDCNGLILRNNIYYQSKPNISFADEADKDGVIIDYSRFDTDLPYASNSITEDPQFESSYTLGQNSPCIDTGHPDIQYNDVDGSRNDMGAYGGPSQ